jgi:type 1 fimbriae regulatory protein FimB/type 1 fimbriae regulatory protein FimE
MGVWESGEDGISLISLGVGYGHRDATMILIAFRHGLRPVEVCNLKWDSIDLAKARIHVNRAKNGGPSTHPLSGVELRALRRLKRESIESPFVFVSERGSPFTTAGYRKMIARLGEAARFSFPVHPHMLRHACGYKHPAHGSLYQAVA